MLERLAVPIVQAPMAGGPSTPELAAAYAAAVRDVGVDLGVVVVDHAAAWQAAGDGDEAPEGWLDDAFHPGARGQHELTLTLLDALGLRSAASEVCLGSTPLRPAPGLWPAVAGLRHGGLRAGSGSGQG